MDPATLVTVEEYLHTDYSPDCDYVDGVLEDRNVGKNKHAETQTEIAYFLRRLRERLKIFVFVEQRVQISATRFRVPDVCVLLRHPEEEIVTVAPFLCVEVVSPDDRMSRILVKIRDYLDIGVPYVWVIDPYSRKAWTYTSAGAVEVKDGMLRTNNPDIEMPLSEVWP
jgi:Uma2 family endonuclease